MTDELIGTFQYRQFASERCDAKDVPPVMATRVVAQ